MQKLRAAVRNPVAHAKTVHMEYKSFYTTVDSNELYEHHYADCATCLLST